MKLNKKIISCLLALAIVMTALPMTLTTMAADTKGIKATIDRMPYANYASIIGEDKYEARVSYDGNQKFDASINTLLENSTLESEINLAAFPVVTGDDSEKSNNYIKKWTGTMTAKETATYTLVGRKIDNGFVMFVNDVKVYEYWGASHWFDGAEDRLSSDKGAISVEAGKTYEVVMYYLELGGGDALEIKVATDAADVATEKAMDDAFTFDLKEEFYRGHNLNLIIGIGNGNNGAGNGGNGAQCEEANAKYDASIAGVKAVTTKKGETVTVGSFEEAIKGEDNYLISYEGYLVPKKSGTYTFGALKVDNCFYMEIEDQTVYEFWAAKTWNDIHGNTYTESIELEEGKAYKFEAAFLEIDGGEALNLVATIDDDQWSRSVSDLFTFYTDEPSEITPDEEEKAPFVLPATNDQVIADVQFVQGTDNVIAGMSNSTIRFDSSEVLSQVNESMTIEMIVKITNDALWDHGILMSIGDSNEDGKYVVMGFMGDGCVKVNAAHHNEESTKLPLNKWVTLKFEIGKDSIKGYLNNEQVTETAGVDVASLAGTEMNFGSYTVDAWGDTGFTGAVAQVRITTPQVVTTSGAQMRYEGTYGLRFKGAVHTEETANAEEYGMVIMPKDMLKEDYSDLTIDNANALVIPAAKTLGEDGAYTEFTGVVTNIPETGFDRELVAKAYVTIDGKTTYADAQVRSYAQVAEAVYENDAVDPEIKADIAEIFGTEIVEGWENN